MSPALRMCGARVYKTRRPVTSSLFTKKMATIMVSMIELRQALTAHSRGNHLLMSEIIYFLYIKVAPFIISTVIIWQYLFRGKNIIQISSVCSVCISMQVLLDLN